MESTKCIGLDWIDFSIGYAVVGLELGDFPRSGIRNKQVSDIEFFLILPKLRKILHTLPGPTHEQTKSI